MRTILSICFLSCGLLLAQDKSLEVVPIDKEPSHHLVFENEYVRVFSVEVAPHSETKYHQHDRDYVWVSLGDSDVESVRVGAAAAVALRPKDGETQFTKGGFAHKAVNRSDKPFRNVTVELKKGAGEVGRDMGLAGLFSGPTITPGRSSQTLLVTQITVVTSNRVRCSSLHPTNSVGGVELGLDPGKYLVIAAAPLYVNRTQHDQGLGAIDMKDGDVRWMENFTGKVLMTTVGPSGVTYCEFFDEPQGPSRQQGGPPGDRGPATRR